MTFNPKAENIVEYLYLHSMIRYNGFTLYDEYRDFAQFCPMAEPEPNKNLYHLILINGCFYLYIFLYRIRSLIKYCAEFLIQWSPDLTNPVLANFRI